MEVNQTQAKQEWCILQGTKKSHVRQVIFHVQSNTNQTYYKTSRLILLTKKEPFEAVLLISWSDLKFGHL